VTIEKGATKKMLIIALLRDEATRRQAEDELTGQFAGHGVPSYTYLGPLQQEIDRQAFVDRLRKDDFDALMVLRLVDITKEQTYVSGGYPAYYGSPYGYYGYAYPMYADPGYVRTDMNYRVETNFYSVETEKLVWSGVTSTFNPTDLTSGLTEIVRAIKQKMRDEHFLTEPPKP
ncbi:MAG TPA: hypothetical protein VKG92_00475, partial [Flavobacteriales bacterium]|nr:hypothetical protein [Flavobacteriales bacterium]